jgi:3-hydroxyisobutyrate dehydrogenase-like beta-hydroxyacid dehydrogenase
MPHDSIGFIGLGDMGRPMARRLLERGFTVVSCAHRRREAIEALKHEGLVEESNPRAVAARVDTLITLVVDDKQTDAVLRGPGGALSGLRPGATVIIMSTLGPSYCQALAAEAAARGITVLDCPISGGTVGAEKGTLALMVGGDVAAMERARPALEVLGAVTHCGEVGAGQIVKLANNAIAFTTFAIIEEARAMARAYGTDMRKMMEIVGRSTGKSHVADNWDSAVANWEHLVLLGKKDAGLCIETARAKGVAMPLVEARYAVDWALGLDETQKQ